jgi:hypothetical protein
VNVAANLVDQRGRDLGEAVVTLCVRSDLREDLFFGICGKDGFATGNNIATSKLLQGNTSRLRAARDQGRESETRVERFE